MTNHTDLIKRLREHWTGPKGRLCQEAADALEERAWQPIATAPRDGTQFLFRERGRIGVGAYVFAGYEEKRSLCAQLTSSGHDTYPTAVVTHWMPLPEPPND